MTWKGELRDSPRTAPQDSAYLPRAPDDPVSGDSSGHPSPARPQPLRAPSGSRGPEATRGLRAGGGHRTGCGTRAGPWGPPLASLSLSSQGSPGSMNPGEARVGRWSALRTRGHARTAGRGAHGPSHRALSLCSRRAPQAGWALGGVVFPEAWTWAWCRFSRAQEPPSSCPQL